MFRRMLISALFLSGAATLYGCSATRSISANSETTFRERGLSFVGDSVQTAARTPGVGLSSTRTSANGLARRAGTWDGDRPARMGADVYQAAGWPDRTVPTGEHNLQGHGGESAPFDQIHPLVSKQRVAPQICHQLHRIQTRE